MHRRGQIMMHNFLITFPRKGMETDAHSGKHLSNFFFLITFPRKGMETSRLDA